MIYIDYNDRKQLYKKDNKIYQKYIDIRINIHNRLFISKEVKKPMIVNGYKLDKEQKQAIVCDEINILTIAGAGSGKSLTIVGKIDYLINRGIKCDEIICISLTNDACESLKKKIEHNVPVMTFHKLALMIIGNDKYNICSSNYLDYVVNEYFQSILKEKTEIIEKNNIFSKNITYSSFLNSKDYIVLKKTIIIFINLFKAKGYNLTHFCQMDVNEFHDLLCIIIDIYILYKQELKSQNLIDFDDMIILATNKLKNNKKKLKYKYIIIDEFQDTSLVKLNLIKAIVDNCGAKTFVVGDDYQSIYQFTGCDLDIFINYNKYMNSVKQFKIINTYRNSKQLIKVANKFILKNHYQITKHMQSKLSQYKPIKIIKYQYNILDKLLSYLIDNNEKDIMLLGRNNNDINKYLNNNIILNDNIITYKNYDISIKYLTVHKAKGLEANCVIVLNLFDDILGFPCKIKNPDILSLINKEERIKYEEERRLFYVCLTRTKKDIYLICPINLSIFVKEIISDNKKHIEYLNL